MNNVFRRPELSRLSDYQSLSDSQFGIMMVKHITKGYQKTVYDNQEMLGYD